MDTVEQSSVPVGDSQSPYYVMLLTDYSPSDNITIQRGERCLVLRHHDNDWLLVSHPEITGSAYVPTVCVQRVSESSDRCLGGPNASVSVTRAHTLGSSTKPSTNAAWPSFVRSVSQRSSHVRSSTSPNIRTCDDDDDSDDDLPEPPTMLINAILSASKSPPADRDVSLTSSISDGTAHRRDISSGEDSERRADDVRNSQRAFRLETTDSTGSLEQTQQDEVSFLVHLLLSVNVGQKFVG
jgi:hypothetical protein